MKSSKEMWSRKCPPVVSFISNDHDPAGIPWHPNVARGNPSVPEGSIGMDLLAERWSPVLQTTTGRGHEIEEIEDSHSASLTRLYSTATTRHSHYFPAVRQTTIFQSCGCNIKKCRVLRWAPRTSEASDITTDMPHTPSRPCKNSARHLLLQIARPRPPTR